MNKIILKKGDLVKIQPYGSEPCLGEVESIQGNKVITHNGTGEYFENNKNDCEYITEANAIEQGLL